MSRKNTTQVTVYDKDNKPHLMTHLNARDMITHNGWSLVPVDKKAAASGDALLANALSEAQKSNADLALITKELNGKTKAEMIALAADRYGAKIDGRKGEQVIIDTILELEAEAQAKGESKPFEPAADEGEGENEADENKDAAEGEEAGDANQTPDDADGADDASEKDEANA